MKRIVFVAGLALAGDVWRAGHASPHDATAAAASARDSRAAGTPACRCRSRRRRRRPPPTTGREEAQRLHHHRRRQRHRRRGLGRRGHRPAPPPAARHPRGAKGRHAVGPLGALLPQRRGAGPSCGRTTRRSPIRTGFIRATSCACRRPVAARSRCRRRRPLDQGPRRLQVPGRADRPACFLRQTGFVEPGELKRAGKMVGSKEEKLMLATLDEAYVTSTKRSRSRSASATLSITRRSR